MLFNSYVFLGIFLPATLVLFVVARRRGYRSTLALVTIASFAFYGWWNVAYVPLLAGSIVGNWVLGSAIRGRSAPWRGRLVAFGIAANLVLLGTFKYATFLADNLEALFGVRPPIGPIELPLAISFFTFLQIAYLVDEYRGLVKGHGFVEYTLFVAFFPHLIAGPIVHHAELIPQFARWAKRGADLRNLVVGTSIFAIGLFKKTVLADTLSLQVSPVFEAAAAGHSVGFVDSWAGALAYTFQIYFDFSGYSDMAIGLARMFGIRLPVNFASPYKATSIIDFWRRWHMTLSRFLRNYLYYPLGGNRSGEGRRYVNLMIVMLLGGLWHGAGWTFVIWGGLHGLFLVVNRAWRSIVAAGGWTFTASAAWTWLARGLTFLAVVAAWVFFRSPDAETAFKLLSAMAGRHGIVLPASVIERLGSVGAALEAVGLRAESIATLEWPVLLLLPVAFAIAWFLPNTQEIMRRGRPALAMRFGPPQLPAGRLEWRASPAWACALACLAVLALLGVTRETEFLYFQF
ncbi:MAG: MBOAT family protein [Alphaproteobacteria bacterium]